MTQPATKLGGFCLTADAIVPLYDEGCDWCGSRHHFVRYIWNEDTHTWDNINAEPGYLLVVDKEIPKIENYE